MDELSFKQEAFCMEMARCGNATEAYIKAGYKAKDPAPAASRLLKNAKVQARRKELSKQIATPKILTIQERRELLSEMAKKAAADGNNRDYKAAIKAIDTLNKMDGAYVTRQEVDVRGAMPVVLVDDVDG